MPTARRVRISSGRGELLAEKQREAEELLQTGADALTRGDRATARELLTSAERAGGSEEALALLHRLDRLEAGAPLVTRPPEESPARPHRRDEPVGVSGREARLAWIFSGIATGILLAAIVGGYFWLAEDPFELTVARAAPRRSRSRRFRCPRPAKPSLAGPLVQDGNCTRPRRSWRRGIRMPFTARRSTSFVPRSSGGSSTPDASNAGFSPVAVAGERGTRVPATPGGGAK